MIPSDDHYNLQKAHDFKISCDEIAHASGSDIDLFDVLDFNSNPQSSFSIRNYVFNSRSKNIGLNWPFSNKSLQICLQYEVKNILPPFQSLESVRNNSYDGKSNLELTLEPRKSKKPQTDHLQDISETKSKKPVLGSIRKTETETAMASKICPVCKIFSSSSSTTLNAHIDQCLSDGSTMKWTANPEVVIKHRIKPRKMRLMVDIYKTATHCTVEELDARNGTSWANNSSFPDQEIKFQGEREKDEYEDADYIETNRKKARILSVTKGVKDASNYGSEKKEAKSDKLLLQKKKNKNLAREHDHPDSNESSFEVAYGPKGNVDSGESCNKEVMNKDDLRILRPPWACSKQTGFAEKDLTLASDKSFSKSGFKSASSLFINNQNAGSLTPNKVHIAKKRSLQSTKACSKHLKIRSIILHNYSEGPSNSCLIKGSEVRSSSRKKLSWVSRKTESKINSKRKVSAHKIRQDSWLQKSWIKEDTSGKTSRVSMNLLEVINNEKMEPCRPGFDLKFSTSLNEDPSYDIESVRKQTQLNKEQVSTMQVTRSSNHIFDSRGCIIDVKNDTPDSPNSTISNPTLARSDSDKFCVSSATGNDKKYILNTLSAGDWWSKGQSQTTGFNNDHQPCCCSRKEITSSQTLASTCHDQSTLLRKHDVESLNFWPPPLPPQPMKLAPYSEGDSSFNPSKPIIRLMGKNLIAVNTNEDNNVQNGFKSQHLTFSPPNSLKNQALDRMFQSTACAYLGPMIPVNENRKNSVMVNTGSFQAFHIS